MEIIKIDLDEIVLKFTTKGSQTRHANLWNENDGILEVIKKGDLTSIYKLKEYNKVMCWQDNEKYRYINLRFNNFTIKEFISKCKNYDGIHISYGCLLDEYTRFRDNDSRYDYVKSSFFKNVDGIYIEQYTEDKEYPFDFLYNYKTRLLVNVREKTISISLTFLDEHLEDWKDKNGYYD